MKQKRNVKIEYHADDYGLFPVQSQRILDCHLNGNLNGVSVMPNSPYLRECLQQMYPYYQKIEIAVHLNLIQGNCLSDPALIPLLADKDGRLTGSFGKLLLHSFLPGRDRYRRQLKLELREQINAVRQELQYEDIPLRLDGHAHYHMIPVVFDALMDVIREDNLKVSYIRIPREYPGVYLRSFSKLQDFSWINLVKVLILNLLSGRAEIKYRDFLKTVEKKMFMGVLLSGRMYYENVVHILPDALSAAEKLGMDLEILGHPGGVYEEADIASITNRDDVEFLTSQMRRREKSLFLMD